ncbi:hypothetical protein TNCV_1692851 [Trichonephila clavipes]|nr:hypothetical protein TNCV_1692851 [Trichonephila clavipes]
MVVWRQGCHTPQVAFSSLELRGAAPVTLVLPYSATLTHPSSEENKKKYRDLTSPSHRQAHVMAFNYTNVKKATCIISQGRGKWVVIVMNSGPALSSLIAIEDQLNRGSDARYIEAQSSPISVVWKFTEKVASSDVALVTCSKLQDPSSIALVLPQSAA